jgi:DNA-binding NtrC family response regulator
MFQLRQEHELGSLARALRRQVVGARAVLLVADALNLSARELLGHTAGQYRAELRKISVGTLGDVVKAVSLSEPNASAQTRRVKGLSLDAVARFVLDRDDPGSKLDLIECAIVARAMVACAGNQSAASRLLGIERKALARRLAKDRRKSARRRPRRS